MKKTTKLIALLTLVAVLIGLVTLALADDKIYTSPTFKFPKERIISDPLIPEVPEEEPGTEPEVTEEPGTEPAETTEPVEGEPTETTEPVEGEPEGTEETGTEPVEGEPEGTEETGTEPVEGEPEGTEETGTEPVEGEPEGTEETGTEPVEGEPEGTEETGTEPVEGEPTETTEPVTEPEGTEEPGTEPTEQAGPVEGEPTETTEPVTEPEPEKEPEAPAPVERKVMIYSSRKEIVTEGDIIELTGALIGFEDVPDEAIAYQWQVDRNDGAGWVDVDGATKWYYKFIANKETILYNWRLIVTVND